MKHGRPLRFLALVLAGWTAARLAMLATGPLPPSGAAGPPPRVAHSLERPRAHPETSPAVATAPPAKVTARRITAHVPSAPPTTPAADTAVRTALLVQSPAHDSPSALPGAAVAPLTAPTVPRRSQRWRIDAWLVARGGGAGTALTPQLGGSQAGARFAYTLDHAGRIAAFARAATPLGSGAAEAAAGVQVRLPRLPVTAFAELRTVDGRAPAPGVGAFAGLDQQLGDFRLTGYAQGGYASGRFATFYADGQLGLHRPLAQVGRARLTGGVGVWGAAQRGATRLDLGPGVAAAYGPVRLGLDWRVRVAGDARPGSGPALTLAAGF